VQVAAENRLSVEQLAALAPGDVVCIESGQEFGRRRYTQGTVIRLDAACVHVACAGPGGRGRYVGRYRIRDGQRVGGGGRAELVSPQSSEPVAAAQQDSVRRVDRLYREWRRRPGDDALLRELHATIGELLASEPAQ
jgi:hypothetical protein